MSSVPTFSEVAKNIFFQQLHLNVQQKKSRLAQYVEMLPFKGGERAFYDNLKQASPARKLNGLFEPVQFSDSNFGRRELRSAVFTVEQRVDKKQIEDALMDPTGKLAQQAMHEMERVKDRVILEAMFADVKTGKEGETTLTAAQDGVLTVNALAGLTYEKILEIKQNFIDNEVGNEEAMRFVMGITGDEHTSLLSELELTSGDYTRQPFNGNGSTTNDGSLQQAVGIDLVKFAANAPNPMLAESGGVRTSFCMAEGAIALGVVRNWELKVQEREDLHDTVQIIVTGRLGAVRTEGKLIQKVTLTV